MDACEGHWTLCSSEVVHADGLAVSRAAALHSSTPGKPVSPHSIHDWLISP